MSSVSSSSTPSSTSRSVRQVITSTKQREGGGFIVRRPIGHNFKPDPILMLDHMGPVTYGPGEAVGAPDHPHRGQETITYLIQGSMQHKDSHGHHGTLQPGDVQWMTAGGGIIHSEMPSDEIMKNGGTVEGFQIWLNLPAKLKMTKPRYQELKSAEIPTYTDEANGVKIKVVAGKIKDVAAAVGTHTPIVYYDVNLTAKGNHFGIELPRDHNAVAYVYRGKGLFGSNKSAAVEGQLADFGADGDEIYIENGGDEELRCLVLAGVPLNEPVVWSGPFVLNTQAEVVQAMRDYQNGKFGLIPGAEERRAQTDAAIQKSGGPIHPK